ncbi:MAG TPA: hypothetical protein VFZ65_16035 [Planctomycetota bacterium]|nr:hypothetical protein [Planctomycetota bacterium]
MSMQSVRARRVAPLVLSLSCGCLFGGALTAQATPPGLAPLSPAATATQPFVASTPDGTVWARGADWKAAFTPRGMQFVPFLGSDAPRNLPLTLELVAVDAAGSDLALDQEGRAMLVGAHRIEIRHGACTERFDLARGHVEQSFVFDRPSPGGALRLRLRVDTELNAVAAADGGLSFGNERGGVRYGRATAVDARGERTAVAGELHDRVLTLTVPPAFVEHAAFPLVVDPLVSTFTVAPGIGAPSTLHADCAHLGTYAGLGAVVHEEIYSATDHDVFVTGYASDGSIAASAYVDYTTTYWGSPAIASHRGASQFLVVAARGLPGNSAIWGCTLTYAQGATATLTPSPQFAIQVLGNGKSPDVGGDANPSPPLPGGYCVTWEGINNGKIYYNIVRTDTSLLAGNGLALDPGPEVTSHPAICKSSGLGPYVSRRWIVVWQKRTSPSNEDIHGSVIAQDGTVPTLDFAIDTSPRSETNPRVSSPTDPIGGFERYVVVYERAMPAVGPVIPANQDLFGQVMTATTPLSGPVDLSQFLSTDPLGDQMHPCVDTDGTRFVVGFTEDPAILNQDTVPFLATLHVLNDTFGLTSLPESASSYLGRDDNLRITAERSGGTLNPRYLATWESTSTTSAATDVHGAYYMGHLSLGPTSYFSEQIPSCGGSQLVASGLPAIANTFVLDLQGTQAIPVILFGDWINPTNVCANCQLGVDPATMLLSVGTQLTITVPQQAQLIGAQFGTQGLDLLAPNGCTAPLDFTLSNMILITLL